MIERLLAVLTAAELEPDTGELRDALWLARHISVPEASDQAVRQRREAFATPQSSRLSPTTAAARSSQEPAEATTGAALYAAGSRDGDTGYLQAMEARSPAVPALRHQLPLARALKPFKRRVPSQTSFVVDEAATAARVAEEGIWLPVLRPRRLAGWTWRWSLIRLRQWLYGGAPWLSFGRSRSDWGHSVMSGS